MNLVQRALNSGGQLAALILPNAFNSGTGLMNPSVFVDDDGDILVNLRNVNYTLYHSENKQKFPSRWGPLAYLHPEKDLNLRTINYLCRLTPDLKIQNWTEVEMLNLHTPIWEFTGLEDARVVRWDGDLYLIGVRRDTTPNGQGRMEYSKINLDKENWTAKEESRVRIPAPGIDNSYCEKNWYPILDRPYHFVKWTMPTEVVYADPTQPRSVTALLKDNRRNIPDQRGGSQLVPWNGGYISVTHEVYLYNNYIGQKDGTYRHRLVVWDKDLNVIGVSPEPMHFLDAKIEFAAGAAKYGEDLLLSFGFQDNMAFVLRVPRNVVNEMVLEAVNGF